MVNLKDIKPNPKTALLLAKRELALLVTDSVNLEGIAITLPEVQTLLEGITVGGHKLSDITITQNQAAAWQALFRAVADNSFTVSKTYITSLHAIAAHEEALIAGAFRNGNVTIAGTNYKPPDHNTLDTHFEALCQEMHKIDDIYQKAIFVFLQMARILFFFDVNKRLGRLIMNGILLTAGYPIINVPAKKKLLFNQLMLNFYENSNMQPMQQFMRECLDPNTIQIMST